MPDDVMFVGGRGSCPECRVGKHDNCDGGAWDFDTDQPTACPCWAENHGARSLEDYEADLNQHHDSHLKGQGW